MKNRQKGKPLVPPADMILDLLSEKPGVEEAFLNFYDSYIRSIATVSQCYENKYTYFIDEDLDQELRIALVRSLPILRRNILDRISRQRAIVMIF